MINMEVQDEVMAQIIKGKRTKRQRLPSPLRLAMPSSTSSSAGGGRTSPEYNSGGFDLTTTSPTTTSADFRNSTEEEEDMANCLILLAQGQTRKFASELPVAAVPAAGNNNHTNDHKTGVYLYQCKTCNRCFPSFQALGGHRASHKKPKANANTEDQKQQLAVTSMFVNHEEDADHYVDPTTSTTLSLQISNAALYNHNSAKSKVHECSICGAEFSSGQALGGHMRRHRTSVNTSTSSAGNNSRGSVEFQEAKKPRNVLKLDLNLPAPEDDHRGSESKFPFQSKEKVIVLSASSLVDCHY